MFTLIQPITLWLSELCFCQNFWYKCNVLGSKFCGHVLFIARSCTKCLLCRPLICQSLSGSFLALLVTITFPTFYFPNHYFVTSVVSLDYMQSSIFCLPYFLLFLISLWFIHLSKILLERTNNALIFPFVTLLLVLPTQNHWTIKLNRLTWANLPCLVLWFSTKHGHHVWVLITSFSNTQTICKRESCHWSGVTIGSGAFTPQNFAPNLRSDHPMLPRLTLKDQVRIFMETTALNQAWDLLDSEHENKSRSDVKHCPPTWLLMLCRGIEPKMKMFERTEQNRKKC